MLTRTLNWTIAAGFVAGSILMGCQGSDNVASSFDAPLVGEDSVNAIPGEYIVVFNDTAGQSNINAAMNGVSTLRGANSVMSTYSVIPGFSARLSQEGLEELRRNPDVAYVEVNQVISITAETNGQDRVDQRLGRDGAAYDDRGLNGEGVHAYIIDTGVNLTHNEFTGRMGEGFDAVTSGGDANDCQGHGTHVASTVAGTQYGLANRATVHPVRVLNCQGSGTLQGVISGVDWVAANAIQPAVANMSLGGGASQAIDDAVANLVQAGVVTAVAAGNDGNDACGSSPAREPLAITVGATEDTSDARTSFSNHGSCLDIYAPGRNIKGAWIGGNDATNTISGTSMASPHVAGVIAQYLGIDPRQTPVPTDVQAALEGVATNGCVTDAKAGSPNVLLHNDFNATDGGEVHCEGNDPGDPGDPKGECLASNACGGQAADGCYCDFLCVFFGDCCSDNFACFLQ